MYITLALSYLTNEKIYPIANVGYDIFDKAKDLLTSQKNIDLSGLRKVSRRNIHSYILYASEYGTQYDDGVEIPITFKQISPYLVDSKFIIISPMTGFDIELNTLKEIRKNSESYIYLDYHVLSLGRDKLGNRFIFKRNDWIEWCTNCDFLQLNRFEAESIYEKSIVSKNDALEFSQPLLKKGVKSVAITLGNRGAFICYNKYNKINVRHLKPLKINKVIDSTGCGDVFAAGFVASYLKTGDILSSYSFANKVAGLKTKISGINNLSKILEKFRGQ